MKCNHFEQSCSALELRSLLVSFFMLRSTPMSGKGSRVGAVVRALASHQCVPGSIPGPGVICGLSLLLVLTLLRGIFSGFSGFPPSTKINFSKFQFNLETVDEEPLRGNTTANSHLFIFILFIYSARFYFIFNLQV